MRNYISPIIYEKLPDFLKKDFKKFSFFIKHYFEFLEEKGNPLEILENFKYNLEVNNEVDLYIDKTINEMGFNINKTILIPKKELILHLKNFYLSRGNVNSFKFLFKVLYNIDILIDYPRRKLFSTSNCTYSNRYFLYTTTNNKHSNIFKTLIQTKQNNDIQIESLKSKNTLQIENVTIEYGENEYFLKLQINNSLKKFIPGESIKIFLNELNQFIIENIVNIIDYEIINSGYGYNIGDNVHVYNPNDNNLPKVKGLAKVKTIKNGGINKINIISQGSNYKKGDYIIAEKVDKGHSFSAIISEINDSENYISTPAHSDFNIENINFTMDCWIYLLQLNKEQVIMCNQHNNENTGWCFKITKNNRISFQYYGQPEIISDFSINFNVWYHILCLRKDQTIKIYLNGKICSEYKNYQNGQPSTSDLIIGTRLNTNNTFVGYIDELRLLKGIVYYNLYSPITIDNENYDSYSLLLNFDGKVNGDIIDSSLRQKPLNIIGNIKLDTFQSRFSNTSGLFSGLGKVSKITIFNTGMNYETIPALKVISKTGQNCIIEAESTEIGQITSIEFIEPFIHFEPDNTTFIIDSINGQNAIIKPLEKTIFKEKASFKSFEGILGINCTLLDSYFHQQFSYEIYSSISRHEYDNIIDNLCHPVGFNRFAILEIHSINTLIPDEPIITQEPQFINDLDIKNEQNIHDLSNNETIRIINSIYNLHYYKDDILFTNPLSEFDNIKVENTYNQYMYLAHTSDCEITIN